VVFEFKSAIRYSNFTKKWKILMSPKKSIMSKKNNLSDHLPVVGIGASAGGLEAFKTFFDKIPINTGMTFVLIPHLDPGHKSLMEEIIRRYTDMPVTQVKTRIKIEPNQIYILPPNRNLTLNGSELVSSDIPGTVGINLPVDIFFRSLALAKKKLAIGVILSGTMQDGAMGLSR